MIDVEMSTDPTIDEIKSFIKTVETEALNKLKPFWENWARKVVIQEIATIFVTQNYGTWASLSIPYVIYKHRHFPGKTILRRKDSYFRAATKKGVAGNLYEATDEQMIWGIDEGTFASVYGAPYPIFHEVGTSKMASRPVFSVAASSEKLHNNLVIALSDYLSKVIVKETKKHFK